MLMNQIWNASHRYRRNETLNLRFYPLTALLTILLCSFPISVPALEAHKTENTRNTADQTLRSNARINPATLAMELSIPIAGFPGRGNLEMPLVFNYSSKIWRLELSGYGESGTTAFTTNIPRYAEKSAMGWTSSFGTAQIEAFEDIYDCHGNPLGEAMDAHIPPPPFGSTELPEGYCGEGIYYITRMRVKLPDGSTQELRKDDFIHEYNASPIDWSGTYLATDGSRSRLEMGATSSVLYLPDGARYYFQVPTGGSDQIGYRYEDRHGNRLDFNISTRTWTDTLGRSLVSPIPLNLAEQEQSAGTQAFTMPGLTGTPSRQYQLIWKNLGDSGVLLNPGETLYYPGSRDCPNGSEQGGNALFQGDVETRICRGGLFNPVVLTEIVLPNQLRYKFWYNRYGEITQIEYPTGSYERFEYSVVPTLALRTDIIQNQMNRGVVNRWVRESASAPELHWKYEPFKEGNGAPGQSRYRIRTTAPDGLTITEQYLETDWANGLPLWKTKYGFENPLSGRPYEERLYSGTTLKSRKLTEYEYAGAIGGGNAPATRDPRAKREITVIFEPGSSYALATMTENIYDTAGSSDLRAFSALNLKTSNQYEFILVDAATSSSPARTESAAQLAARFNNAVPVKRIEIDYSYGANYINTNRSILGMVTEQRIVNPANNNAVVSRIQMRYDEYSFEPSDALPAFAQNTWADPQQSYRGNVTSIRTYTDIANNQYVEAHSYYDQYGNLRKSVDARGFESRTEYSADYASAYPTKTISPVPDPGGVSGSNAPLETTVSYDFNTGLPRYKTDPNNQTTEIQYNDSLLRPTKAIAPNGQQTTTEYGALTSDATRFVKVRTQIDAEKWKESYTWLDGFGRTIKTQSIDSAGDVFVITSYDEMGRVKAVSNPFRNVSNPTCATNLECATTVYDAFGRVWKVTAPDGAITETTYTLATVGSQIGNVVTVKDAASKERRSITNALGQLIRVDEPNDAGQLGAIQSPAQPTLYAYDTLNNLKTVTQGEQTRTFAYDALSRLKSATNPESGTISYAYDPNGNLLAKTDARGVLTTYAYDPLNRVKSRTYGNEPGGQTPTPAVSYFYDNLPNAKGKLIKVGNAVSTTEFTAFDVAGRPTAHAQTTDGQTYATAYSYNLAGLLTEQTYPNGRVVKNVLDADGELSIVQSRKNQNAGFWNYARHFSYTPSGAVSSMQLGNGRWESTVFNSRLQPVRIALGATPNGSDLLKLDFTYNTPGANDNNGNVRTQTVTAPTIGNNQGFTAVQSYTYDSLNRIKQASESVAGSQTWKQTFSYDRYGNRNFDTGGGNTTTLESGSLPKVVNPEILASNNRFKADQDDDGINDYLYDAAGNTTRDALNRTFVYDGENKQIEVLENNVSLGKYYYDGEGKRVKKVSAEETVIFVYDATGKLIAEYANQTGSNPKVAYLTGDHLGSPRINTDAAGNVISRHDYRPFGEEIERAGYAMDDVRKQFTGYERDRETDLDFAQARMYSKNHGRFTTTDPLLSSGRPDIAQSWNRYSYTLNNPLRFIDPSGLYEWDASLGGNADDSKVSRDIRHKRNNFRDGLEKAKSNLEKIKDKYGEDSEKYKNAKNAVDSYGEEGKKNGVTIKVTADSAQDKDGVVTGGMGKVVVSFKESFLSQGHAIGEDKDIPGALQGLIAHEGYHTFIRNTGVPISQYENETNAYNVQGTFSEVHAPERDSYITLKSGDKAYLWNSSWKDVDIDTQREQAVKAILKDYYPGVKPPAKKNKP